MSVSVIRTNRKTIALQLRPDGQILLRAPVHASEEELSRFLSRHALWLEKARAKAAAHEQAAAAAGKLSEQALQALRRSAAPVFAERAAHYARALHVSYGRISVRAQRTRWGSCNRKGDLSLNCLLLLAPPQVLDCVLVHELCHRIRMDHSPEFYAHVLRVFPEYERWHAWLRENGGALLRRMPAP